MSKRKLNSGFNVMAQLNIRRVAAKVEELNVDISYGDLKEVWKF